ncbi:hypothetical protein ABT160_30585 [Streptomyces sp. NPDC001941]|uniref:hypothetical protein n=1 Tax=Streptomyces sp. NPDC001941 TaxID=3154659 RepID=UPI00332E1DBB
MTVRQTRYGGRAPAWVTVTAVAVAALAGCGAPGEDRTPTPLGTAAVEVTVVREAGVTYPMRAAITGWRAKPHPQAPDRGDAVFFDYRVTRTGPVPESRVSLAVCAVDASDMVLLCTTVSVERDGAPSPEKGDGSLGPTGSDPDLSRTARVLFLPNQMKDDGRAGDPKDHDGYTPPRLPGPGDQLRARPAATPR